MPALFHYRNYTDAFSGSYQVDNLIVLGENRFSKLENEVVHSFWHYQLHSILHWKPFPHSFHLLPYRKGLEYSAAWTLSRYNSDGIRCSYLQRYQRLLYPLGTVAFPMESENGDETQDATYVSFQCRAIV